MGVHTQVVRLGTGSDGQNTALVSQDNPLPVMLTSGNVVINAPVTISTEVEIKNEVGNPIPVIGPLTEAQLRAAPVVIDSGTKVTTVAALGAGGLGLIGWLSQIWSALTGTITVTGPLTDQQMRAAPVPVSGNAAAGTAPTAPPLSVSGVDSAGNKQHVRTDTSGNMGIYGAASRSTATAAIASGASVSNAIDLTATAVLGFYAPAAWTAAALTLEVSFDNFVTSIAPGVMDCTGTAVGSWSALVAGNGYSIDPVAMLPFRYVRFRSGTAASPVNQAAARAFTVVTRPLA